MAQVETKKCCTKSRTLVWPLGWPFGNDVGRKRDARLDGFAGEVRPIKAAAGARIAGCLHMTFRRPS